MLAFAQVSVLQAILALVPALLPRALSVVALSGRTLEVRIHNSICASFTASTGPSYDLFRTSSSHHPHNTPFFLISPHSVVIWHLKAIRGCAVVVFHHDLLCHVLIQSCCRHTSQQSLRTVS